MYPNPGPWYRDGMIWSIAGCIAFGFLMGLIAGQWINL